MYAALLTSLVLYGQDEYNFLITLDVVCGGRITHFTHIEREA